MSSKVNSKYAGLSSPNFTARPTSLQFCPSLTTYIECEAKLNNIVDLNLPQTPHKSEIVLFIFPSFLAGLASCERRANLYRALLCASVPPDYSVSLSLTELSFLTNTISQC